MTDSISLITVGTELVLVAAGVQLDLLPNVVVLCGHVQLLIVLNVEPTLRVVGIWTLSDVWVNLLVAVLAA